jgi:hypothetical protein
MEFSFGFRISDFGFLRTPMSLHRWYRLFEYLTLGLSCCALVLAEVPFLPDLQVCLAPVLALLVVGWWVDGRWSLPNRGADLLALLILVSGISWVLAHRHDEDLVLTQLPFPLALLPYMGPLLIAALLVKIFRTRDREHFWHVQGMALLQVGLGCMLEGGPGFGIALAAYLASALACVALHYRLAQRTVGVSSRVGHTVFHTRQLTLPGRPAESGRWLLSFASRWLLLIAGPALVLFLLTPRQGSFAWEPLNNFRSGSNRVRVRGGSPEMDLNTTGLLEMDDEVALHVTAATADGQPKLDLPVEQRWRAMVLDGYENGAWTTRRMSLPSLPQVSQRELPNFGRDQFLLTFTVPARRAGGLVLAEPIRFGPPGARLPVLSLAEEGRQRLFAERAGTLLPVELSRNRQEYQYQQVVPGGGDSSRTPFLGSGFGQNGQYLTSLPDQVKMTLQAWTMDLLRRLAQDQRYPVPQGVRAILKSKDQLLLVPRSEWEATARVLSDYLGHSGEFTYSLAITREDRTIDPVLDFILNLKSGHCERYAAALASILRSVGIPARIIKGFRGWDSKGGGKYAIRHRHAHAWVEILVPRSSQPARLGFSMIPRAWFDWLTLDPTPPATFTPPPAFSLNQVWLQVQNFCVQTWRWLIVEYNGDEQTDIWENLTSGPSLRMLVKLGLAAAMMVFILAVGLILRRLRLPRGLARAPRNGGDAALYPRLVRLLERYVSLRPGIGQTPREYGESARAVLRARPALAALADWPMQVIELFYRVRFGRQPLREEEQLVLNREFDRFAAALQSVGREP